MRDDLHLLMHDREGRRIYSNPEGYTKGGDTSLIEFGFSRQKTVCACPDSTIFLYGIRYDYVLDSNWSVITQRKLYDFKKSYSIDELNAIGWEIHIY